jgi:hypothetical protein
MARDSGPDFRNAKAPTRIELVEGSSGAKAGSSWDRTRPKGKQLGATRTDSAGNLQGDSGSTGDAAERSETTSSDSALGQETDDDTDLDDDPRSQRGPSETTEPADKPGMTGREPPD